jgi:phosphoesterase RecJ-like protein
MTDTGNFAYASSRKDIYHIVAELISKGIDKDIIYRRVFYNYSFSRMRLMGYMMYEKLKYYPERNAALLTLTYDELKRFNGAKGDTEGIVNMPLQIKGTRFSCFLREESKGKINVSLRSVDEFPCNEVAAKFFNGGGHKNASGGEVRGTMEEAEQLFIKTLEEFSAELTE